MGYNGVGNYTKIHYSNQNLQWQPLCKSQGYRTTHRWELVTCKKCLQKREE